MANQLAPEKVGGKIVQWHSCLIAKDIESAKEAREQTILAIDKMKPDDKMLAYYQLISFKHNLLVSYPNGEKAEAPLLNSIEIERDDYLNYMYYYVSGQNEYLDQRYKSAIRTYKIAERLLDKVNDKAEKADFYQKLGMSYYKINQYTFAISYIEQALEIFEKDSLYRKNEITCKLALAIISSEMELFETANALYKELFEITKPFPYEQALTHHNHGIYQIVREQFVDAIQNFKLALDVPEFSQSITALKTTYHIYHLQLKMETYSHGLDELEAKIKKQKLPEYIARCKVSRGLYMENNMSLVKAGLDILESNEFYFEYAEMCDEISQYFESKGDLPRSLEYSKRARHMGKKQTFIGVNQS
ncbi:hypothetical protein ACE1TH_13270 [Shouchella sp. JSM 1781072]|uniref:Rap family tetratricopeptide repeat protein n=1 Tax=Bacillaceae TaxID=186817 RepID=UPI0020D054B1|nr:Rap family tetratricopeptide repeat protein [Alkalihalobacillus sp. LMS6]UTR06714.1 hypothetical protein MM326_01415 [Alkalihalobacillus sp. LMS6]